MTFGEMFGFTQRFKDIMSSDGFNYFKTMRLSSLMTDLEGAYGIPFLKDEKFEKKNPYLMQLYHTVSNARVFETTKRHVG